MILSPWARSTIPTNFPIQQKNQTRSQKITPKYSNDIWGR